MVPTPSRVGSSSTEASQTATPNTGRNGTFLNDRRVLRHLEGVSLVGQAGVRIPGSIFDANLTVPDKAGSIIYFNRMEKGGGLPHN